MLLVREHPERPGVMEIRWDMLPSFLAIQGDLHLQLAHALNSAYADKESPTELDADAMLEIHDFIAGWLQEKCPQLLGLDTWIKQMVVINEVPLEE